MMIWLKEDIETFIGLISDVDTDKKFYQVDESEIKAVVWGNRRNLGWKGLSMESNIHRLRSLGFKQVEIDPYGRTDW